jgi:predicted Rossmann fold nucleotide-binding protein DprA/Smf involved in DNA uptake
MSDQKLKDDIQAALWQVKASANGQPATSSLDHITRQTVRSAADVAAALSELEQSGAVKRQPNGEYAV